MPDFLFDNKYNAIVSRMETLFPTKKRIGNPYDLESNPDIILYNGWGIRIGPAGGLNAQRFVSGDSIDIDLVIIFTKQFHALPTDAAKKSTFELDLINSFEILLTEINSNNFGLSMIGGNAKLGTFEGVNVFRVEKDSFISLECNVTIQYNRDRC